MTKQTRQAANRIFSTCKVRDEINNAMDCTCNELSSAIENIKSDMRKITKEIQTTTTRLENQDENWGNTKGTSPTYADALNRQLHTSHTSTLA